MALWSGIGINYGHQISSISYDTVQVEADFTFLRALGISRIRIAAPPYNGNAQTILNCQDMVTRALAHGFYVVWGAATGVSAPNLTATIWTATKAYVTGTVAPWAQSNGLSELCLCNEADFEADGSTLTTATVRSDVRSMATSVKAGGYTGKVSYSTANLSAIRTPWITEGIGALDLIGWNSYDTLANFTTRNGTIVSAFGNATYISEFGCITNGFSDYNDEVLWYTDVQNRIAAMQSASVAAGYFFCYRDGGFGLGANTFACMQTTNTPRLAREALGNATLGFSALGVHA